MPPPGNSGYMSAIVLVAFLLIICLATPFIGTDSRDGIGLGRPRPDA